MLLLDTQVSVEQIEDEYLKEMKKNLNELMPKEFLITIITYHLTKSNSHSTLILHNLNKESIFNVLPHDIKRNILQTAVDYDLSENNSLIKNFKTEKILSEVATSIDSEIARLKKDKVGSLFTTSSLNKITSLEELKQRFQNNSQEKTYDNSQEKTYGEIIEEWEKEITHKNGWGSAVKRSEMLYAHRNLFSDIFSQDKTITERYIVNLKKDYGNKTVSFNASITLEN